MATSLTSTGVTFPDATTQTTAATSAGGTLEAVASGALSTGDMVVVNTDGTVSVVSGSTDTTPTIGTAVTFESGGTANFTSVCYDPVSNAIVVAYRDVNNGGYCTAIAGTISGTTITFGTPVVVASTSSLYVSCTYDTSNQAVVIGFYDALDGAIGKIVVGEVSGTTLSNFGGLTTFNNQATSYIKLVYDSTNSKVVVLFTDDGNSSYGSSVVGTVSGNSISFGSKAVFNARSTTYVDGAFDSANGKVVVGFTDSGGSGWGTSIIGTVSGTSISFGGSVAYNTSGLTFYSQVVYDPVNQKIVIAFEDYATAYGKAIVGTVSGTSISFGTAVTFATSTTEDIGASYDGSIGSIFIAYYNATSSISECVAGIVSGTSISFSGSPTTYVSGHAYYSSSVYDDNAEKTALVYRDGSSSNYGKATVVTPVNVSTNLTAENFIGVSDGNYSDTDTATVLIAGSVSDAQTSLTAGQTYYVQKDGTISTTPDDPSVFAGTAISSTKLIVQG